ncbi:MULTISPECIES: translation initiation factor IF-2 [Synechocystis]|uniref:Translation initiation factor IF-2 n=1 Tax=Synechocystis salina LEGE 00031 TaxID=1828736 RepID=A0ABR9VM70_9SYNC|nr:MULTISPECIES: translation initiation factor IF-2 [Synechocystis]MBD2655192.1 translation initiation factor IF-2 [Synechocystis sp. FACHB-383]MBE9197001.1 translation initiation factor IF-2 [Synechocystis sp. LEGE 06083]MBE9239710.1 translation initiation factor IF-2 [Synechocystis salina LEGE 00041]MBE9252445.1 translation initiation factor IF-2 [Synechocystis salina LEGE 00031]QUS60819.1 translation initiation factor IF-2 [Synechocystis sp. PCC 7338]
MGFADLSIQSIATEYDLTVQSVFDLCDQLGIAYKNQETNLALEDAKAVIMQILHRQQSAAGEGDNF